MNHQRNQWQKIWFCHQLRHLKSIKVKKRIRSVSDEFLMKLVQKMIWAEPGVPDFVSNWTLIKRKFTVLIICYIKYNHIWIFGDFLVVSPRDRTDYRKYVTPLSYLDSHAWASHQHQFSYLMSGESLMCTILIRIS